MELVVLLVLVVLSVILKPALAILHSWTSSSRELRNIPGNLGWPFIGESLSFISEFSSPFGIYSFLNKRQQRCRKLFKTNVLGRLTVFMTRRDASKVLLSGKNGIVSLNLFYTGKQVLGPSSLLQTTGEEHKRLRTLIGQPLSVDGLKNSFHFINVLAVETLDRWQGRKMLVLEEASTPSGTEQEKFQENFKIISSAFASLPLKIPGFAFHNGIKARDRMYEMLDSIISRRRNGREVRFDFLQFLLQRQSGEARTEEAVGDKLADSQLEDNILILLIAGHDTTTAALTWVIKFLEENPSVLENLKEEHRATRENRKKESTLTWSEVNCMSYTNKVISETLRKATVLPWFSRKAAQDFEIDGYNIKKGWSVNLDVVSIHHDPEIFTDPDKFDPPRFDKPLKPFSFLGFGSGPRMWKPLEKDDNIHPTLVHKPKNKYPIAVEPM